jgi:Lon protease-like protein
LFPLGTVLFPGGRIPLKIFETRYVDMISRSMRESAPFGIVGIINGREIGLTPEFHRVGTTATIESWDQGDDGLLHIVALGAEVFEIVEFSVANDGLALADVTLRTASTPGQVPLKFAPLRQLLQEIYERQADLAPPRPLLWDDADWVAYRLAEIMPVPIEQRVEALGMPSADERLAFVSAWMEGRGIDRDT